MNESVDLKQQEKTEETLTQAAERFWEAVPAVWDRVRENLRATAAAELGITVAQFHILRHIRRGRNTVNQLADARQISRSAASQMVDLLVEKGYVRRQERVNDRRYVGLELTDTGAVLLNAAYAENRKWIMKKLSALSPAELERMLGGLEPMKKAFL